MTRDRERLLETRGQRMSARAGTRGLPRETRERILWNGSSRSPSADPMGDERETETPRYVMAPSQERPRTRGEI
jgi:hypothetical protein